MTLSRIQNWKDWVSNGISTPPGRPFETACNTSKQRDFCVPQRCN
jgi:hypothetical protein